MKRGYNPCHVLTIKPQRELRICKMDFPPSPTTVSEDDISYEELSDTDEEEDTEIRDAIRLLSLDNAHCKFCGKYVLPMEENNFCHCFPPIATEIVPFCPAIAFPNSYTPPCRCTWHQ